jgi:hypothetical protein
VGTDFLRRAGQKYQAEYAVMELDDPPLDLPVVYSNRSYVIYRIR